MLQHTDSGGGHFDPNVVRWNELSVPKLMGLSAGLSVFENAFFYPFFLLKTREQVDRTANPRDGPFELTRRQFRAITQESGFRGLYRGYWSCSLGYVPSYVLYLMTYIYAKDALGWDPNSSSLYKSAYVPSLAGLLAEGASIGASVPIDVVVQKIQANPEKYRGGFYAASVVVREEGFKALYRGAGATMVLYGVVSGVWWAVYEKSKVLLAPKQRKRRLPHEEKHEKLPPWKNNQHIFAAGFIAGTVTALVANPLDVVKTRLQVGVPTPELSSRTAALPGQIAKENIHREPAPTQPTRYRNLIHGIKSLYREEGIFAFAKGIGPKLASKGVLSAITSISFETVVYFSRRSDAENEWSVFT